MDRKSTQNLQFDRRLLQRKGWISPKELESKLAALPDVAAKAAPVEDAPETETPAAEATE